MRVLLDANILISNLLNPKKPGSIRRVIHSAICGDYTLLLTEGLLEEFVAKIPAKPFLSERIAAEELAAFVAIVRQVGEVIEELREEIPAVTRDPKDDYLLAYAVVGEADYLVTGDEDLLVFRRVGSVKIIRPVDFASLLEDV